MSVSNSDYLLTSICPAAPGWRSVWFEASSTASVILHEVPVACWGVARYSDGENEYTETVGIVAEHTGMEPLEALDGGGHCGYLAPEDDVEKLRGLAIGKAKRDFKRWAEEDARRGVVSR